jgi:hypothetical protein
LQGYSLIISRHEQRNGKALGHFYENTFSLNLCSKARANNKNAAKKSSGVNPEEPEPARDKKEAKEEGPLPPSLCKPTDH